MGFVGRKDELMELKSEFDSKDIFAIYGLRSVGKSRLVETFINQLSWRSIWIDMGNMKSMRPVYMTLLQRLLPDSVSAQRGISRTPTVAVEDWWTGIQSIINEGVSEPTVIVLDNAEDVVETERIAMEFLQMCVLLTSTSRSIKVFVTSTTEMSFDENSMISLFSFHLKALDQESSAQLLSANAPTVNFGSNMATIVELCEGLPLALLMTSSILEDKESLFAAGDMVRLLRLCRMEVLSQALYQRKERIGNVYGEFLRRLSVSLRNDLATLVYIPGSFTDSQASAMIGNTSNKETHITTIQPIMRRNIIHHIRGTDRYDVHGILRDCVALYLDVKNLPETRKRFCKIFARLIIAISEKVDSSEYLEGLCLYNLERQNFQKLLTDVMYTTEDTYGLYMELALRATHVIQSFMIEYDFKFYTELMRMCRNNKNYVDEVCIQIQYGSALTNVQGDLMTGETNYMKALTFLEHNSTNDSTRDLRPIMALAYQRIGWNIGCQGRCQEALRYLYKALKLEQDLNMYYEELAMSTIQSLSCFHVTSGNVKEGIKLHQEALKRRIECYKTDQHPYVASCINNLGIAYRKLGQEEEALHCFQRALVEKKDTKGTGKSIAISMKNVAWSLTECGNHVEAWDKIEEAFSILNKTPNLYLEIRCYCHAVEGRILRNTGQDEEAIQIYKMSLTIAKSHAPVFLFECMIHLEIGELQFKRKRYDIVLKRLEHVFKVGPSLISEDPSSDILIDSYVVAIDCHVALRDMYMATLRGTYAVREIERLLQVCNDFELEDKITTLKKREYELKEKIRNMKMIEFKDQSKTSNLPN
ncbi:uncharacterized protein LOC110442801 [Mizuhopecten yessoensis]|uniref:UDP-N-acetylglucosamine--peptide N-acetylglucosaminyltransferase SEC n=1 Tax=Mizuhopecten yessoensis TaxID=6573 RepID=A0A210R169_MIZYE|nr:uncharacterized protein LOC110442801 [Mizuhopecten yessoensis]OWF54625.1 UDP-N-acetylglucosamine--peptide N-acetylglucosaminyltransferase SEC [Mizuhopecten yessoensis]